MRPKRGPIGSDEGAEALRRYKALRDRAERLHLESKLAQKRFMEARERLQRARDDLADEMRRVAKYRAEPAPEYVLDVDERISDLEAARMARDRASSAWQDANRLVDRCRRFLIEHGLDPDRAGIKRSAVEDPQPPSRSTRLAHPIPERQAREAARLTPQQIAESIRTRQGGDR